MDRLYLDKPGKRDLAELTDGHGSPCHCQECRLAEVKSEAALQLKMNKIDPPAGVMPTERYAISLGLGKEVVDKTVLGRHVSRNKDCSFNQTAL